jgi:hypothetical protein
MNKILTLKLHLYKEFSNLKCLNLHVFLLSFCLDDEMDKAEDQLLGANTVNNENAEV